MGWRVSSPNGVAATTPLWQIRFYVDLLDECLC